MNMSTHVIKNEENDVPRPAETLGFPTTSDRRVLEAPVLQKLKKEERSEGECKEVHSDVEEKPYVQGFSKRRRFDVYHPTSDLAQDNKMHAPDEPECQCSCHVLQSGFLQQSSTFNQMDFYGPPAMMRNDPRHVYHREPQYPPKKSKGRRRQRARKGRPIYKNRSAKINQPKDPQARINSIRDINLHKKKSQYSASSTKSVEVQKDDKPKPDQSTLERRKMPIEFMFWINNIDTGLSRRDFKAVLRERGIKPRKIRWKGYKGFACIKFVKPHQRSNSSLNADEVYGILKELPIPPQENKTLIIKKRFLSEKTKKSGDIDVLVKDENKALKETTTNETSPE